MPRDTIAYAEPLAPVDEDAVLRAICADAAEYMRIHGATAGRCESRSGRVCLIGAIYRAAGGDDEKATSAFTDPIVRKVVEHMGFQSTGDAWRWHDKWILFNGWRARRFLRADIRKLRDRLMGLEPGLPIWRLDNVSDARHWLDDALDALARELEK